MSLNEKLDRVLARHSELRNTFATHNLSNPVDFAKLSKEYSDLTEVASY